MNLFHSNLLRIISIIAVIIIHTTYASQKQFSKDLNFYSLDFLYVLLNQIARFSVPVFVILSGYGLTAKYQTVKLEFKEFYKIRFFKIGIPFIFWTFIILLFKRNFIIDINFLKDFIYYLSITGVDYHFYFFIIILQCYIVFPFLFNINNKIILFMLFIFQIFTYTPTDKILLYFNFTYYSFPSTFLFSWLFYFYFGIYLKRNENTILPYIKKNLLFCYFIFIISFFLMIGEYIYYTIQKIQFYNFDHFHRYSVLFYSLSFFFIYFYLTSNLKKKIFNEFWINKLSHLTFPIYIFHTQFLRLLDTKLFPFVFIKTLLLIFLCFSFFYYMDFITNKINKKYIKIFRILIGL
ncbi:MAG: acyltransferase [Leptospiraceae bacterium]|nr:MAG: acyltransferase [Leptospiraceae bacterium]